MDDHVGAAVEQWRSRRPDLDLTGMEIFGRLARLARVADLRRDAVLQAHGLSAGEVDVLAALWRHGDGLRPLELRRAMMVGSGTLTARLDRLEAAGLLERRPDPGDQRGRELRLTARGRRVAPKVVTELLEVENELLSAIPPQVQRRLARDLEHLLAGLEDQAGS